MLYRPGSTIHFGGRGLDWRIVADEAEQREAISEGWYLLADLLNPQKNPLDHDGDGMKGGSLSGEQSTRARGRRKKLSLKEK